MVQFQILWGHLARDLGLKCVELVKLLTGEYTIEDMRGIIVLTQVRDKTPGEIGARARRLSVLTFPENVRENAVIHAKLAGKFFDVLKIECIRYDVI